jgi:signal transduction histidine kinase
MLFIFLAVITPFWILDLVMRANAMTPPQWLGDTLALALLALGAAIVAKALAERRRSRLVAATASPVAESTPQTLHDSLPCLVHEIRNYSSILKGNASLLRSRAQAGSDLEPLSRLERTTHKIECLAQEILDTATSSHLEVPERLCVLALVETCLAEHFHDTRDAIRLTAEGALPAIEGDPRKLERVFINLFKNAFEAGASNIKVSLVALPNRLRVLVEDDGKGCGPECLNKLFRPLYTTKKENGGTGLGLFIVKTIMEAHGGVIRAVSKNAWAGSQQGMIFCLELPAVKPSRLENTEMEILHALPMEGSAGK